MNIKTTKRRRHLFEKHLGRRGSATLELGITLMVLLYITFGSIDWGYYLYTKNQLVGAAREGARAGIISGATNTDVSTAVTNVLNLAGLKNTCTVTTSPASISAATSGTAISITLNYNWGNGLGLSFFSRIPVNKTVSTVAVMRKE